MNLFLLYINFEDDEWCAISFKLISDDWLHDECKDVHMLRACEIRYLEEDLTKLLNYELKKFEVKSQKRDYNILIVDDSYIFT